MRKPFFKPCLLAWLALMLVVVLPAFSFAAPSAFEEGVRIGQSTKSLLKQASERATQGKDDETMQRGLAMAQAHLRTLQENWPEQLERLRGIAQGSGVGLDELGLVSMFLTKFNCAQSASAPPATKDSAVYLSWNLDLVNIAKPLFALPLLSVTSPENGYKTLVLGIPYLLGIGLMNEKGLSLAGASITVSDSGEGLTPFELSLLIMERCRSVKEAVNLLENVPRFSTDDYFWGNFTNWSFSLADATGGIGTVEFTSHFIASAFGDNGILARANCYDYLPQELTTCSPENPMYGGASDAYAAFGSMAREARMYELLRLHYGNITLQDIWSFTADTNGGKPFFGRESGSWWTIERHTHTLQEEINQPMGLPYVPLLDDLLQVSTTVGFVMEPKRRTLWVSLGHPGQVPYLPVDLGRLIDPNAQDLAEAKEPSQNAARLVNAWVTFLTEAFRNTRSFGGMYSAIGQELENLGLPRLTGQLLIDSINVLDLYDVLNPSPNHPAEEGE
jgi:hypothetical protein